ncbi:hypothetical protein LZ32DRAFT_231404 [Colletotrichum eremochloae]|nr:hypothetical protein LZ32DRAFT_231404 [Colletotrichum eremochloae]
MVHKRLKEPFIPSMFSFPPFSIPGNHVLSREIRLSYHLHTLLKPAGLSQGRVANPPHTPTRVDCLLRNLRTIKDHLLRRDKGFAFGSARLRLEGSVSKAETRKKKKPPQKKRPKLNHNPSQSYLGCTDMCSHYTTHPSLLPFLLQRQSRYYGGSTCLGGSRPSDDGQLAGLCERRAERGGFQGVICLGKLEVRNRCGAQHRTLLNRTYKKIKVWHGQAPREMRRGWLLV